MYWQELRYEGGTEGQTFFATKWLSIILTVLKIEVGCEVVEIVLRGVGTGRTERDEREMTE